MAILHEFKVEIIVDGLPTTEYDDDDEPELNAVNTVTKYVEAVSGKAFHFKVTLGPNTVFGGACCFVARPQVEGVNRTGLILDSQRMNRYTGQSGEMKGEYSGNGPDAKLFRYMFASLETRMVSTKP